MQYGWKAGSGGNASDPSRIFNLKKLLDIYNLAVLLRAMALVSGPSQNSPIKLDRIITGEIKSQVV